MHRRSDEVLKRILKRSDLTESRSPGCLKLLNAAPSLSAIILSVASLEPYDIDSALLRGNKKYFLGHLRKWAWFGSACNCLKGKVLPRPPR